MPLPLAAEAPASFNVLGAISALLGIGLLAQWVAWRLHVPSILLLLAFGFAAGPGRLDLIDPGLLLGDNLLPIVSVAVGIILFEGGLSLRLSELKEYGNVVWLLVSLGALVTGALGAVFASVFLGLDTAMAVLLGSIVIVSGPTVVGPLLHHIKPQGPAGAILKWEGIVIDPIGAVAALLVFESCSSSAAATPLALGGILNTIVAGSAFGFAGAGVIVLVLRRYWIPDHLHVPLSLTIAVLCFAGANAFQHESGLLAVTLLGVVLANQSKVPIDHILEFKENLRVLLISILFLLLSARLRTEDLAMLDGGAFAFLAALILVVRPVAVWLCTLRSKLNVKERVFLAWLCPRGIVAAAVASVFALELQAANTPGHEVLVPMTFLVIVGTVVVYGLTAPLLARRLGLSVPNPQGVLFIGAQSWARDIACALKDSGVDVLMIDTNRTNVHESRMRGLPAWAGDASTEEALEEIDLAGVGRVVALTPNDGVNRLIMLRYTHEFGRREVYRLAKEASKEVDSAQRRGRVVFGSGTGHSALTRRFMTGQRVTRTKLTEQFDIDAFRETHGDEALVLFVVREDGSVRVNSEDNPLDPRLGDTVIAVVPATQASEAEAASEGSTQPAPASRRG